MNPAPQRNFGQGRFSSETEELYHQFQKLFGIPEPLAMFLARRAASEAGLLAKNYFGRPGIRYLATHEPATTYVLALVKACVHVEESCEHGIAPEMKFALTPVLQEWLATTIAAQALNDGGATARRKAGASVNACSGCKQWELNGKTVHLPNCQVVEWGKVNENQKNQPSQAQKEKFKINAAIATAKMKASLGPPINPPSPKKSKAHPHSNWPPIVSGGAVESNRRKF